MKLRKFVAASAIACATMTLTANTAYAACATDNLPSGMDRPGGYPARALTMVVPYGPAGGSGQVAQAMAQAVSDLTGISINRDHGVVVVIEITGDHGGGSDLGHAG